MQTLTAPLPTAPVSALLARLRDGRALTADDAETLFAALAGGRLDEADIETLLVSLRRKGETAEELIGAARALRDAALPFERPDYLFADTCGTGGDGTGTINVSTAVAFVAASAGLPIVKHGNRSVTSRCGSADVLEQLGVRLDPSPAVSRRALDETGICFLLAPLYHPGLAHAAPVRRRLKCRTIMNALGPCLNPARPPVQLLGVSEPGLMQPVAATLAALGVRSALVVHGAGMDEVALHRPSDAIRLTDGKTECFTIDPAELGLEPTPLAAVEGGSPEENAARLKALLSGGGGEAEKRIVALNCGALLAAAGVAFDLRSGYALAADALASGAPYQTLLAFAEATHA
ncbi:anthranilate phosphoribosyltransferase [Allosphingosinicella flava]|uniref:Anthranilate phosphoribosyltransferase n=1 Tax=Allosphingosinicella flava TaxID=2771430 RepID=A0A7T2LLB9_9SPHN|nr:anthranilate phosphoribosyltransferase [Sphingosinicella flava]QPQ54341.1 anthranilate phosphoribosyltransferase [Sphingosinicella flava]